MHFDVEVYQSDLAEIRFGKRVGTSLYFHIECSGHLPHSISALVAAATHSAELTSFGFNVLKLDTRLPLISLLSYPTFFDDAFPTLLQSATWSLADGSLDIRVYSDFSSRPVLHRKELMLPPGHEMLDEFASLTELAEQLGLFEDPSRIGRSRYWEELLEKNDIQVSGHSLLRSDGRNIEFSEGQESILRYRTALKRNRLSVPIQILYRHGFLDELPGLFDYGCGRGDDVRLLQELGVKASGWDPHYFPDSPRELAAIVNLGYVINVIEDPLERQQVLKEAFRYALTLMVVSTLTGVARYSRETKVHKDGVITSVGTFQKYFQHHEFAGLIERAVGVKPIAAATGVMYVFKDGVAEQLFLAQKVTRSSHRRVKPRIRNIEELDDDLRTQADNYWERCLELGRPAHFSEVEACDEILRAAGTANELFELVLENKERTQFETAVMSRRQNLLLDFALSLFGRRLYFKYFPEPLKRDIQYHFGNHSALLGESKRLLYSIADVEKLLSCCIAASNEGIGYLVADHSLQLHRSLLPKLDVALQVYVGCAGILHCSWKETDLVKIHIQSGKVSFMGFDDFEGRPVPDLVERVKVRLWDRNVEFYDYVGQFLPTPLLMKSLYIDESLEYFDDQVRFDQALMNTKLFDLNGANVTRVQFNAVLAQSGYSIRGYQLVQTA